MYFRAIGTRRGSKLSETERDDTYWVACICFGRLHTSKRERNLAAEGMPPAERILELLRYRFPLLSATEVHPLHQHCCCKRLAQFSPGGKSTTDSSCCQHNLVFPSCSLLHLLRRARHYLVNIIWQKS